MCRRLDELHHILCVLLSFVQRALLSKNGNDMPRLLAFLKLLRDEGERGLGHFTPSVVNGQ